MKPENKIQRIYDVKKHSIEAAKNDHGTALSQAIAWNEVFALCQIEGMELTSPSGLACVEAFIRNTKKRLEIADDLISGLSGTIPMIKELSKYKEWKEAAE